MGFNIMVTPLYNEALIVSYHLLIQSWRLAITLDYHGIKIEEVGCGINPFGHGMKHFFKFLSQAIGSSYYERK